MKLFVLLIQKHFDIESYRQNDFIVKSKLSNPQPPAQPHPNLLYKCYQWVKLFIHSVFFTFHLEWKGSAYFFIAAMNKNYYGAYFIWKYYPVASFKKLFVSS